MADKGRKEEEGARPGGDSSASLSRSSVYLIKNVLVKGVKKGLDIIKN